MISAVRFSMIVLVAFSVIILGGSCHRASKAEPQQGPPTPLSGSITESQIQRFEVVANDGLYSGNPSSYVDNSWGGHQNRIVRTTDGTIYLMRLQLPVVGCCNWTLAKRDPGSGTWTDILSGTTSDEAHVVRDPLTDVVSVIAYPGGLPSIWDGPTFTPASVPGSWQMLPSTSRHYGNTGMGANGTLCIKTSHEFASTAITDTDYSCRPSGGAWGPFIAHSIGNRYSYDYLFPNTVGADLYGSSQYDLYKDAAGYPNLAGFAYVFNGVRGYSTGPTSDAAWQQEVVFPGRTTPSPATDTIAPEVRQHEAFVDSKGRAFSVDFERASTGSMLYSQGFYLSVTNPTTGAVIYRGPMGFPFYGSARVVEDDKARLWVLWTNAGTRATQVVVASLDETTTGGGVTFTVGCIKDLTASFAAFPPGWAYMPYEIYGVVYLAAPRGGTVRSGFIDGYMDTCTVQFPTDGPPSARSDYNSANCFHADGSGQMSVVYFRIQLPN